MSDRARAATARPAGTAAVLTAAVVDTVLVMLFAFIGRASHAETLDALGVWSTGWPFLAGLAAGWLAARAWRHPLALWPTGVTVWAATVGGGLLLRLATGEGAAVAFVIVATVTLALFLLGWRVLTASARRIRRRRRTGTGSSGSASTGAAGAA